MGVVEHAIDEAAEEAEAIALAESMWADAQAAEAALAAKRVVDAAAIKAQREVNIRAAGAAAKVKALQAKVDRKAKDDKKARVLKRAIEQVEARHAQSAAATRARGDVGAAPLPRRARQPEVEEVDDSDTESLPGLLLEDGDTDSDSGSDGSALSLEYRRPGARAAGGAAIRRAASKVAKRSAKQVLAPLGPDEIITTMDRVRLIRELHIPTSDPRGDDPAVAEALRAQVDRLVRSMQRKNFLKHEPTSGDELQSDLDYMVQHACVPRLLLAGMRHALEESIPRSSALDRLQRRSSARMAKFIKVTSAQANRLPAYATMPRALPAPRAPGPARMVLGLGRDEPDRTRYGDIITCNNCHQPGHFADRCPTGGGGGRGGGRARGRGRGQGRHGHDQRPALPLAIDG